jgi:hypothetical protein
MNRLGVILLIRKRPRLRLVIDAAVKNYNSMDTTVNRMAFINTTVKIMVLLKIWLSLRMVVDAVAENHTIVNTAVMKHVSIDPTMKKKISSFPFIDQTHTTIGVHLLDLCLPNSA